MKQAVLKKLLRPIKVPGAENTSDVFTKHVSGKTLKAHFHKFGIRKATKQDLNYSRKELKRINKLSDLKRQDLGEWPDPIVPKHGCSAVEHS